MNKLFGAAKEVCDHLAARPKDWIDAESIALRQKGLLDVARIVERVTELAELKGEPEITLRARKILEQRT